MLNYFFEKLFFNLEWKLSKDFSSFVEFFQQNCQKWTLRVQRVTSTKTLSGLCEAIFDLGQGNVWFAAEILQPSISNLLFCLQMGNWKNSFERIFTFSDFFSDVQGTFFWFFRCILRGLVVQTEFVKPRWTYPLGKNSWENFLSFPD